MFVRLNKILVFILFLVCMLTACQTNKEEEENSKTKVIVSAAASLTDALEEIKEAYQKDHPSIMITYNFGGSGNLSQQIQQGAPANIFLSASEKDMDALSKKGLIEQNSRIDFAQNKLVVISNQKNKLNLSKLEDLAAININDLAMGDVQAVPAGRYGKQSFENAGIWDKMENTIVNFSDVRQVLTQVETGNAELGIVYQTDVLQSKKAKIVLEIDPSLYDPIIYPAAIIKQSSNKEEAAQSYLEFLTSQKGKKILESYGFLTK